MNTEQEKDKKWTIGKSQSSFDPPCCCQSLWHLRSVLWNSFHLTLYPSIHTYRRWQLSGAAEAVAGAGGGLGQGGAGARLDEVKEKSRSLLEFAMSVSKEHLSKDTIARLQRLESMMM